MKKTLVSVLLLVLLVMSAFSAIVDYVPADASFAMVMRDNAAHYEQLKNVGIFGFLLRDMGLESMVAQQFESMKYTDPDFKPENFWGLLGGDVALFAQGDVDFSALVGMLGMGSDPTEMLPEVMGQVQNMTLAFIIKPTADPDLVINTWNKVLGMQMAWGIDEYSGMVLEKADGHILLAMNEQAISIAKAAKANNILNNPHFRKEYEAGNWMVMYSKNQVDTEGVFDMVESGIGITLPEEMLEGAEMDYSMVTLRVGEALELRNNNIYNYTDNEMKAFIIESNADLEALYKNTSIPGAVMGMMVVNKMEEVWKDVEPVFNDIVNQLVAKEEMPASEKAEVEKVFQLIKGFKGKVKFGMDISLDESLNPLIDLFLNVDMDKMADVKNWMVSTGEIAFVEKNGYSESEIMAIEKGDELDLNLYLGENELIISSMKADQLSKVNTLPVLSKNAMFSELSNKYSFKKGNAMLFVDIGTILTKILGVAYPSGMFLEIGTDENANSRMIAVIK
ncbi:MAG: hypothetical protein GXY29_04840 [Thermotogaceae bacterium]|nr:hypothetical protein [Thermotogaceae bacterium]